MSYRYQVHDISSDTTVIKHFTTNNFDGAETEFESLRQRHIADSFQPRYHCRKDCDAIIRSAIDKVSGVTVAFIKRVKLKSAKTHAPLPLVWLAFPTADHREKFRAHVEQRYAPGSTNLEAFTWSGHRYVMSVDCVNTECLEGIKLDAVTNFNGLLCDGNGKIKLDYSNESTDVRDAVYRVALCISPADKSSQPDAVRFYLNSRSKQPQVEQSEFKLVGMMHGQPVYVDAAMYGKLAAKQLPKSKVAERVDAVIHEEMCNAAFGECNLPRTPMTFCEACEVLKIRAKGSHIDALGVTNAIRTVLAYVTK